MPGGVQRLGDPNTVGGVILQGQATVLVNNRPVAVVGSRVTPHPPCGKKGPQHCAASTTSTNATVLVNGRPIVTNGDIDTCGHARIAGSTDVIVGV